MLHVSLLRSGLEHDNFLNTRYFTR